MRLGRLISVIIAAFDAMILTGCALPQHSNTLLFATNTVVALDVSANATTSAPNITIGYKRQEMAWVPLLANKTGPTKERQPADCPPAATATKDDPCVFQGRDGTSLDAYSVLATFAGTAAASGSGGSTSPSTSANGSIAQYFATGMAARLLADKGGAQLVNSGASSPNADEVVAAYLKLQRSDEQKLNAYFSDATKFTQLRDALIANTTYPASTKADLKAQTDLASFLEYARQHFAIHDLALAIPTTGGAATPPPAGPATSPPPSPASPPPAA